MAISQTSIYVSSELNQIFKDGLRDLRTDLGRTITLHFHTAGVKCPNCLYDPDNDASAGIYNPITPYPAGITGPIAFTGGFCGVCSGIGSVSLSSSTSGVQVLLRRLRDRDREYQVGGKREFIKYRVKADVTEYTPFLTCDYILIDDDNVEVEVTSLRKRGLKDDTVVEVFLTRSDDADNSPNTKLT